MKKFFYRAQEGETVLSVAQKFSVPVCVLINDNLLKEEISSGDLLIVRKECAKTYKVKPDDTLEGICNRFGISKEQVIENNGVPYLFYGLSIII